MSLPISNTSSLNLLSLSPRIFIKYLPHQQRFNNKVSCALRKDSFSEHNSNDKVVEEDMIVLRMRIREMKMSEEARGDVVPPDWMDWERKYYAESYNSDICEAVGLLQLQLMSTRPSLALAMLALVSLSLPISIGVVLQHLLFVAKEVVLGFHF